MQKFEETLKVMQDVEVLFIIMLNLVKICITSL